jgi:hypothetical protein
MRRNFQQVLCASLRLGAFASKKTTATVQIAFKWQPDGAIAMIYVPPTIEYDGDRPSLFLAGGITDRHLRRATARLFWFPSETLCPIALFELGCCTRSDEPLFVGVDPTYRRRFDVEEQLKLARPDVKIVYGLRDLAAQVLAWEKTI